MDDDLALPVPELISIETINLGPIIDPPFADANDWSEYLDEVETKSVDYEELESPLTEDLRRQVFELALSSEKVTGELDGKRYETMGVGLRSLDRETEHPLVVIYNYTDDLVIEVLVDLGGATVLEVFRERYQPPLAPAELSLVLDMVRENGRLPEVGIDVDTGAGIVVVDENFRSPRYGHRLVDLRFGPEDRRVPTAFAIVDVSDPQVVRCGLLPEEVS